MWKRAASGASPGASRSETGDGSFADQVALKFGECSEDVEDEAAGVIITDADAGLQSVRYSLDSGHTLAKGGCAQMP